MARTTPLKAGEDPAPSPIYFFDASALVKVFVQEPGAQRVRDLFQERPVYTSWILIAEAMGVLKRKWLKQEIKEQQYGAAVYTLFAYIREGGIRAIDVDYVDNRPALLTLFDSDVMAIRRKYPTLDVADALQFKAIQTGILRAFAGASRPQLVTGDKNLCSAARAESIPVIYVGDDFPSGHC